MAMRIYIGNLPYSATDQGLAQLFAPYGAVVEARLIVDRASGQSKGFGFVEMSDDGAARSAIAALDGTVVDDRAIRVNEARERPDRPARARWGNS